MIGGCAGGLWVSGCGGFWNLRERQAGESDQAQQQYPRLHDTSIMAGKERPS
jgi:hypothetical protein